MLNSNVLQINDEPEKVQINDELIIFTRSAFSRYSIFCGGGVIMVYKKGKAEGKKKIGRRK